MQLTGRPVTSAGKVTSGTGRFLENTASVTSPSSSAAVELQIAVQNQLPDGWVKHMDQNTGQPFFVHTRTGASQWDPPVVQEVGPQQARQGRAEEDASPLTRKSTFMPEGWSSSFTDVGQKYYVHQASQKTQWERPPGN